MAFRASAALNKGALALVAVICVALVVCSVGQQPPAEAVAPAPSCAIHRCISECPTRCNEQAASSCEGAKGENVAKCKPGCVSGCTANCRSSGATTCDDDCDRECDSNCKSKIGPNYSVCLSSVFQYCKDTCEKGCKGEKSG